MVSIAADTDYATPGCGAHLRITDLEPAVGLRRALWTADHTHTPVQRPFVRDYQVSRYQKAKTNLDFTETKTVSGSSISWAICKSASRSRHITTPTPHHSIFTGRMPFVPANQQRQGTEGRPHLFHNLPLPLRLLRRYQIILLGDRGTWV